MVEFKALRVPALTSEVASDLETLLQSLPGVSTFKIVVETQTLEILFDDKQLDLPTLAQEMAMVGCPLRNINAALFKHVA